MFKFYGNFISLCEELDDVDVKICCMFMDLVWVCCSDLGMLEKCLVWEFYKVYFDDCICQWVQEGCIFVGIGCLECKKLVIEVVQVELELIWCCVEDYLCNFDLVCMIVFEGCEEVCEVVCVILDEVCLVMGF